MASTGQKWLLGCGIGCGVVLLISILLGVGGFFFFRNTFHGFQEAIQTRQELEERFGTADTYAPPPSGAIYPDRMAIFLNVRSATDTLRQQIAATFDTFEQTEHELESDEVSGWEKLRIGLHLGRRGISLGSQIGDFYRARNGALLAGSMGLGEYTYIYVLAYYDFLGHSPAEGPVSEHIHVRIEDDGGESAPWDADDDADIRAQRRRVARELLSMLHNELARLEAAGMPARLPGAENIALPDSQEWHRTLSAEISRLEQGPGSLPWREGLPAQITASLAPYRERLQETYSAATNSLELARNREEGVSIHGE
jgi:hypothetical protein